MPTTKHPLEPLAADEITAAVAAVRGHGGLDDQARFAYIGLDEPDKGAVRGHVPGTSPERRVRLQILTGPEARVTEAVVRLTGPTGLTDSVDGAETVDGKVESWVERDDVRPVLLMEEALGAVIAVKENPAWQEAMAKRGIIDLDLVQIDPWPAGAFDVDHEVGRRICRCLSYLREDREDNGYARPVEGVIVFVDMGRGQVLEVIDTGAVPMPPERGSYYPELQAAMRDDLRPVEITQPEGPSFRVAGNLVEWQRWSLRVSMDSIEGLVIHDVSYRDGDRSRPILFRASVDEMVVPYGDPGPLHGWKNAFDVGEWGLGRMANSLTLGCDCLGEIHYFDAIMATERGEPYTLPNAICMHEEDYGILWKHNDLHSGRTEVRRSRRLVVSSIATVGNYEYGFFWYFYLDGTIQLETKLTGIMSTQAIAPGETPRFATVVAPQLAAPFHQHLFNVRLDVDVDGGDNSVEEVEAEPLPPGPDNPWANAFEPVVTPLTTEQAAQRTTNPATSRHWRIVNRSSLNRLGRPVAYKLLPGATPTLLAHPESNIGRRARFATKNLWVTPYDREQRRAAGDYPNQHRGGDGLPAWTADDRSIQDRDLVVWYTYGITHFPRPEDWPVMPVEYCGFSLVPVGFFERNPALDVPPSSASHCHAD